METLLRERSAANDLNSQILRNQLLSTQQLGELIGGDQLAIIQWIRPQNNQVNQVNQGNQVNRQLNTQNVVNQAGVPVSTPGQVVGGQQTNIDERVGNDNRDRVLQGVEQVEREIVLQQGDRLNSQQGIEQGNRDQVVRLDGQSNGQSGVAVAQVERRGDVNVDQRQVVNRPILGAWPQVAWTTSPVGIITRRIIWSLNV